MNIYQNILSAKTQQKKLLAVLIDPEKFELEHIHTFFNKVHQSIATHIFVGGSTDSNNLTTPLITAIKKATHLPVVLFPGNVNQITREADGILFLSLISGRNPEYLIEQQVKAAPILSKINLEIIPTGYLLIDGEKETSVQKVSQTKPIPQTAIDLIVNTALAGEFSGKKLIYLEAGSGAMKTVNTKIISTVSDNISIPLIVGGGIRTKQQIDTAYKAGADLVVIGTAFENDVSFFNELKKQ